MANRQKALARRQKLVEDIGINKLVHKIENSHKAKPKVKKETPVVESRYPLRSKGKIDLETTNSVPELPKIEVIPEISLEGEQPLKVVNEDGFSQELESYLLKKPEQQTLNTMPITEWSQKPGSFGIRKVCSERIYSISFCPTNADILVACGDKTGELGLWRLNSTYSNNEDLSTQGDIWKIKLHMAPINRIRNVFNSIYTCSYDGSIKCLYPEKHISNDVFYLDNTFRKDATISDFININNEEPVFFATINNGSLSRFDTREPNSKNSYNISLHEKKINTVSIHPSLPLVATSSLDRTVSIWDYRLFNQSKTKCKPLYSYSCKNSVNAAFFDPKGESLVITSYDDTFKIFDINQLITVKNSSIFSSKSKSDSYSPFIIKHDNDTGKWLSKFQASFCPLYSSSQSDLSYYITSGSMTYPRCIDMYKIYKEDNKILSEHFTYRHELLNSVLSITDVHPYYPAICGGNSSGRVGVFIGNTK
ncbi:hypothetical protein WA158_005075 [Blastocystis sp. Blastoise]